jgi:hypothetical protein
MGLIPTKPTHRVCSWLRICVCSGPGAAIGSAAARMCLFGPVQCCSGHGSRSARVETRVRRPSTYLISTVPWTVRGVGSSSRWLQSHLLQVEPVRLLLSMLTFVVLLLPLCATGDTPLLYIAREGAACSSCDQLRWCKGKYSQTTRAAKGAAVMTGAGVEEVALCQPGSVASALRMNLLRAQGCDLYRLQEQLCYAAALDKRACLFAMYVLQVTTSTLRQRFPPC